jgi:hypothetical protein
MAMNSQTCSNPSSKDPGHTLSPVCTYLKRRHVANPSRGPCSCGNSSAQHSRASREVPALVRSPNPSGYIELLAHPTVQRTSFFAHRYSPNEFVHHSVADSKTEQPASYFHRYREAVRLTGDYTCDEHELHSGNRATRISHATSTVSKRSNRITSLHCDD